MQMDFTVPIIDNFGDMGFALSLAVSMMEKHPDLTIRFWSEDAVLFERMLAGKAFPRLSYHAVSDWNTSDHSEIRCNFFGLKLIESELQAAYPHTILNFDYLQFHKDRGPSDPGIGSIHGTTYTIGKTKVIHLVPTILEEGGGVVPPETHVPLTRGSFIQKYTLDSLDQAAKWCSVFVYPTTLEMIRELAENHPETQFLICGGQSIDLTNCVSLPFLALTDYQDLLALCDTNIVRWENSLIAASLAGKPFLWDIYRESNGAHFEKIKDFVEIFEEYGDFGEVFEWFISPDTQLASLEALLCTPKDPFLSLAHYTKGRDIRTTIDAFLI